MSSVIDEYKKAAKDLELKIRNLDLQKYRKLKDLYSSYHQISTSLAVIARRIDDDLSKSLAAHRKINEWVQKTGVTPPAPIMNDALNSDFMLIIDVADLYIYTRILFDVLCVLIKLAYGKRGYILPEKRMQELVTKKRDQALRLDREFFAPLFEKIGWFGDLRLQRDNIVHHFAHMRVMIDTNEKHYFQWAASEQSWDGIKDNSIEDFVNNTLSNLKHIVEYLTTGLNFDGIKDRGGSIRDY